MWAPSGAAATPAKDAAMLEKINKAITEGTAAEDPPGTPKDWDAEYDGGTASGFNSYRDLRLLGVDSYYSWTYRMRWTVPVVLGSNEIIAVPNVGMVQSYQDVIDYVQGTMTIPISWAQPSVTCYIAELGGFVALEINEWLGFPPSIEKIGRNYFCIIEWLGATSWSGTLYDGGGNEP